MAVWSASITFTSTPSTRWKHRSTWVHSALSMYRLALEIRDELRIPFKIALAFSLQSGTSDTFSSVALFERELDWSPPSLYLLPRQHSFYDGASIQLDPLPNGIARILPPGTESRLLIWAAKDGEQRRTLSIEGSGLQHSPYRQQSHGLVLFARCLRISSAHRLCWKHIMFKG
jgi:hypothetical protein